MATKAASPKPTARAKTKKLPNTKRSAAKAVVGKTPARDAHTKKLASVLITLAVFLIGGLLAYSAIAAVRAKTDKSDINTWWARTNNVGQTDCKKALVLRPGATPSNGCVAAAAKLLNDMPASCGGPTPDLSLVKKDVITVNGKEKKVKYYDDTMLAAVKAFQAKIGYQQPDGIVGPTTWYRLKFKTDTIKTYCKKATTPVPPSQSSAAGSSAGGSSSAGASNCGTLRRGSSNTECVKTLQAKLNAYFSPCSDTAGYVLTVDGDFGPKTKASVVEFQKRKGLSQDGVVGPITWGRIGGGGTACQAGGGGAR
jgi:peptidoglycan hydrolase-like protein with peptidoglycan-binding domain